MIQIEQKAECCGCGACVQSCPKHCIQLKPDEQGFSYPVVDKENCIDCGLCEKICFVKNQAEPRTPLRVMSAVNPNEEVRRNSSSGGIFSILAHAVVSNGGVVFGARFDENWEVCHAYTEAEEGIADFMGSKYVQSRTGETYKQAKEFLQAGRQVLFSGTPCQIAGLKTYLKKDYDLLYTIEVVCHGVPSPQVWRDYLKRVTQSSDTDGQKKITGISFRDKSKGWKNFSIVLRGDAIKKHCKSTEFEVNADNILVHEPVKTNVYMQGFLNNLTIRPSCFKCPAKQGRSRSDFSLADFWAIQQFQPDMNDDKGVTLLYVHTEKAEHLLAQTHFSYVEQDRSKTLNVAFSRSTQERYPASKFWKQYSLHGLECIPVICQEIKPSALTSFTRRVLSFVKRKLS